LEDRLWVPTQVSPHVCGFLYSLSCELARATQSRDCLEGSLAADATLFEAFRSALLVHTRGELGAVLGGATGEGLCEAAVLQLLLDVMFARQWCEASGPGERSAPLSASRSEWLAPAKRALTLRIDPINLQMYEPELRSSLAAFSAGASLLLSHLCRRGAAGSGFMPSASLSASRSAAGAAPRAADDPAHVLSCMPLIPPAARFTLLPVVMEASTPASVRLSPPKEGKGQGRGPEGGGGFTFGALEGAALGAKGAVGNAAANVFSSFGLSALGSTAASTASSLFGAAKRG
jgi:hypothetical protein